MKRRNQWLSLLLTLALLGMVPAMATARTVIPVEPDGGMNLRIDKTGKLLWDSVIGATGYRVEVCKHPGDFLLTTDSVSAGETSYALFSKMDDLGYDNGTYRVKMNVSGSDPEYTYSTLLFYYDSPYEKLSAPANLRWNGNTAEWDAVPDADHYNVYICDTTTTGDLSVRSSLTGTSVDLSDLSPQAGWYFEVVACGAGYRNSAVSESPRKDGGSRTIIPVSGDGAMKLKLLENGRLLWDRYVKVKDAVLGIYGGEGITINRSHIYLETSECALRSFGDRNDPDCYYIKLNGCELTMPGTKLLTTVREDYDDITQVVDADTEQPALKCSIGTTISEIKILGFTPPASGAVLDKTNVHRGHTEELASYRVSTNAWYRIDPATGTGLPMSNGDVFEIGNTYRYKALVLRKSDAFDAFPASAEDLTVTIKGLPAGCEMDVYFNSEGTVLTCDVLFVLETTVSGEVTVSGSKATASVTVKNFSDTAAVLIIAQYSGGRMKAVQTVSVTMNGTFAPAVPFTHEEGCTYRAFLVNADTYAPLCAAAPLSE